MIRALERGISMMKVSFAEIDEAYIRSKVQAGYYSSVTEVIRDAVRRLRENEQHRLSVALDVGERAITKGKTQPLTPALLEATFQRGIEKAKQNEKISRADVTPY
jgi:putative addiction module CopG family antidote